MVTKCASMAPVEFYLIFSILSTKRFSVVMFSRVAFDSVLYVNSTSSYTICLSASTEIGPKLNAVAPTQLSGHDAEFTLLLIVLLRKISITIRAMRNN